MNLRTSIAVNDTSETKSTVQTAWEKSANTIGDIIWQIVMFPLFDICIHYIYNQLSLHIIAFLIVTKSL